MKKVIIFLILFTLYSCPPFPRERELKIISHEQFNVDEVLNVNFKSIIFIQNYKTFLTELYLINLSDKGVIVGNYDFKLKTGNRDFKLEKILGYKKVKESKFNGGYDVINYTRRKKVIYVSPNDSLTIQLYFRINKNSLSKEIFNLTCDTIVLQSFLNRNEYKLMAQDKNNCY